MSVQPRRALTGVPAHAWAPVACSEGAAHGVIVLLASNLGAAETLAEETAQLLTLLNGAQPIARTLTEADAAVLAGNASAFHGLGHGVVQLVSDFDVLRGADRFDTEFDHAELLATASGRPLSMTWLQRDPGGDQWRAIRARTEAAVARGLDIRLQTASRAIGVILGLDTTFHPFMGCPGYLEIAALPHAERAER